MYGYVRYDPINFHDPKGRNTIALGARSGAAIGSFLGPQGTAIGAGVGGLGILLNESGDQADAGDSDNSTPIPPPLPADPSEAPGEGWDWRGNGPPGSDDGAWYNPNTGESLHPDLNHPDPIGPHWDWIDPNGKKHRLKCP